MSGTVDYRPTNQAIEAETYGRQTQETAAAAGMSVVQRASGRVGLAVAGETGASVAHGRIPSTGCGRMRLSRCCGMIRGKLKATTGYRLAGRASIPGGSARPSCARCNDDYRIGGRCMVRIGGVLPPGASAGTRSPVRLHPLRGTQGDHRGTVLPPPAVPADTQPLGMALRWSPPARPSWRCRDCRMPSGPWAAFQRWCAATIPRLPPTNCAAAAAAL